jgi:hypothetical protein
MAGLKTIRRTGKTALTFASLLLAVASAQAAGGVTVSATASPDSITVDDSVNLRINVQVDGNQSVGDPEFKAPDFDVINEYRGTYVESYYNNGQFGMRNNQQVTKVLKPRKTGDLTISGIKVQASGKTYASDNVFTIHVSPSGAGAAPPRGYGGSGVGLRGAGKHVNAGPNVLVRAEVDKDHVYKGEQVIVSYYLYRKVRVFNIQVDKFPTLSGFLREDLEMPVMSPRLDTDRVVVDGVPYDRSLLVRYAAYPLTEGKLRIDELGLKFNYYSPQPGGSGGLEEEDPFMSFFQQMAPRAGAQKSEPVTVDVTALPEDGRPNSFTGGVGDFNVTSAVDKTEVRANEPVTLTVKVEGRGNVEGIAEPKAHWPDNIELYDSKGHVGKVGKGGVGDKTFEFLLIPRTQGKLELPAIEFAFFDPAKKTYITRKTEPVTINVLEPAPGTAASTPHLRDQTPAAGNPAAAGGEPPAAGLQVQGLKDPTEIVPEAIRGVPIWRWLYWICGAVFAIFILLVARDLLQRLVSGRAQKAEARNRALAKSWDTLRRKAEAAAKGGAWNDVSQSYEQLCSQIFDAIGAQFKIGARAYPRADLSELLVTRYQVPSEVCDKISDCLEFAEGVRFAGGGGAQESNARSRLTGWVAEGEKIARSLATFSASGKASKDS